MVRSMLIAVFCIVSLVVKAQDFKFKSDVLDYGKVAYNSLGEKEFEFTNIGNEPIIIKSIQSSCGCTVAKRPEKPIMPGEKGSIKVVYDTKRVGGFLKSLVIMSNAKEERKVLKIKGFVERANEREL